MNDNKLQNLCVSPY